MSEITNKIKTFEDACEVLGKDHEDVALFRDLSTLPKPLPTDLMAYIKLRIVCLALNEGWQPKFTQDEVRYWPWLWLYTQAEYDRLDDADKKELLLFGGDADNLARCGVACSGSDDAFSDSDAALGARLALKSRELAIYCGRQFLPLWTALYVKPAPDDAVQAYEANHR